MRLQWIKQNRTCKYHDEDRSSHTEFQAGRREVGAARDRCRGHDRARGSRSRTPERHTEVYRGREYSVDLIPKTKLELVLADTMVDKAVQAILGAARTGKIGDGKIFLTRVDEAIRIRNDERGEGAL